MDKLYNTELGLYNVEDNLNSKHCGGPHITSGLSYWLATTRRQKVMLTGNI